MRETSYERSSAPAATGTATAGNAVWKGRPDFRSRVLRRVTDRLEILTAHLDQWRDILTTALRFAGDCATAYTRAPQRHRKQLNSVVFARVTIRDGQISGWDHHQPFQALFNGPQFEYGSSVHRTASYSNLPELRERVQRLTGAWPAANRRLSAGSGGGPGRGTPSGTPLR